jgi:hypothetical protein
MSRLGSLCRTRLFFACLCSANCVALDALHYIVHTVHEIVHRVVLSMYNMHSHEVDRIHHISIEHTRHEAHVCCVQRYTVFSRCVV